MARLSERIASSLTLKLVIPVLGFGFCFAALGSIMAKSLLNNMLEEQLDKRVRLIESAVRVTAQSDNIEHLCSVVQDLGAERDISRIVVVADQPPRVRACTRQAWIGQDLGVLPATRDVESLRSLLAGDTARALRFHEDGRFGSASVVEYHSDCTMPNTALVVSLDTSHARNEIFENTIRIAFLFFGALTVILVGVYSLMKAHVLKPLGQIKHAMTRRATGDQQAFAEVLSPDEVGEMASALNYMLRALEESETRNRTIIETAPIAICVADEWTGHLLYCNSNFVSYFGFGANDPNRSTVWEFVADEGDQHKMERLVRSGQTIADWELPVRRRGVLHSWCSLTTREFLWQTHPAVLCGFVDVTRRREQDEQIRTSHQALELVNQRLEQAIVRANELADEAQAASLAKSQFLANMSHEIRTPMNGIVGFARLLAEEAKSPEQGEHAQAILDCGESLLSIINDVLDLSKIEAKQMKLESVSFDPRDLLESVALLFSLQAKSKGVELGFSVHPGVPQRIKGDPTRLRQVVSNLAGNAVKFTSRGHVFFRLWCDPPCNGKQMLRGEVVDTGIGIPEDRLDVIFENFTQADSSTSRNFGGTGLGLSISRHIVELAGGSLTVTSSVGVGSSFHFSMETEVLDTPVGTTQQSALHANYLIWEPRQLFGMAMSELIQSCGGTASIYPDAATLFSGLRERKSDNSKVIIGSGISLSDARAIVEAIKRHPDTTVTACIVLRAIHRESEQAEMLAAGAIVCPVPSRVSTLLCCLAGAQHDLATSWVKTPATQIEVAGVGLNILLAEDNPVNQKLAVKLLERQGCSVKVAENGEVAVRMHNLYHFDLILMDIQMPVLDGLEATRRIRAQNRRNSVPIYALTANALQGDSDRCTAAGMDGYLAKPFKPEQLSALLQDISVRQRDEN